MSKLAHTMLDHKLLNFALDRPRQTWWRSSENDLRPHNLGLATAQGSAQNRTAWQKLVETATSLTSSRWWWWRWRWWA